MPEPKASSILEYIQNSFLGGMNQQVDATRLEQNEYFLLINGRNRRDVIDPIKNPKEITSMITSGKFQGLYGIGNYLVAFVDGRCWIRDYTQNEDIPFQFIVPFRLSSSVDHIYAEVVPASTVNYVQYILNELEPTKVGSGSLGQAIYGDSTGITSLQNLNPRTFAPVGNGNLANKINAALVVQDGVSQPWVIFADGTNRPTGNFTDWKPETFREYVPIGKDMVYDDGILYIVSPDGQELFRSVSGRSLDFVVSLQGILGGIADKGGDASETSYKFDYEKITALKKISFQKGIFASTRRSSYIIEKNFDRTVFGEPTFNSQFLFPTGALNSYSISDFNGDFGFINFTGIHSFNATKALRDTSNNEPFSRKISPLFEGISQDVTASMDFDNYSFFAVTTVYGQVVIVYDNINSVFVGLDIYDGIAQIKQFAEVKTLTSRRLFFITTDNKLYEAFAGDTTATCKLFIGEWCTNNPKIEQKPRFLNVVLSDAEESGTVSATIYADRFKGNTLVKNVEQRMAPKVFPLDIPFGDTTDDHVQNFSFDFTRSGHAGWKVGYLIEWNCQASLTHCRAESEKITLDVSRETAAREYNNAIAL